MWFALFMVFAIGTSDVVTAGFMRATTQTECEQDLKKVKNTSAEMGLEAVGFCFSQGKTV